MPCLASRCMAWRWSQREPMAWLDTMDKKTADAVMKMGHATVSIKTAEAMGWKVKEILPAIGFCGRISTPSP